MSAPAADDVPLVVQRVADDGVFSRPARRVGLGAPMTSLPPTAAPIARLAADEEDDWDEEDTPGRADDAVAPELVLAPRPVGGGRGGPEQGMAPPSSTGSAPVVFRAADVAVPVVRAQPVTPSGPSSSGSSSGPTGPGSSGGTGVSVLQRRADSATSAAVAAEVAYGAAGDAGARDAGARDARGADHTGGAGPSGETVASSTPASLDLVVQRSTAGAAPAPAEPGAAGPSVTPPATAPSDVTAAATSTDGTPTAAAGEEPLVGDRPLARQVAGEDAADGPTAEPDGADQTQTGTAALPLAAPGGASPLSGPVAGAAPAGAPAAPGGDATLERVVSRSVDPGQAGVGGAVGGSAPLSPAAIADAAPQPGVGTGPGPGSTSGSTAPLLALRGVEPRSTGTVLSRSADAPAASPAVPMRYAPAVGTAAPFGAAAPTGSPATTAGGTIARSVEHAADSAPALRPGAVAVLHRQVEGGPGAPVGAVDGSPEAAVPGSDSLGAVHERGEEAAPGDWTPGALPLALQRQADTAAAGATSGAGSFSPSAAQAAALRSWGGDTPAVGEAVLRSPDYEALQRSPATANAPAANAASEGGGGGGGGGAGGEGGAQSEEELEKLAGKLYERLRYRIRREYLNDRERAGFTLDKLR